VANPWLSVVLPTYNGAAHLPAALDSVVSQGDNDAEVIAVDDGSTDATVGLLESYGRRLSIRIIRRQHTGNWVANTNHGLSLARGAWVSFLHQDDVWLNHRLAGLRAFLARQPDATLVLQPSWYIDGRGNRLGLWRCPLPGSRTILESRLVVERLLVQNFIALPAPLFRRDNALRVGGLQEDLWYTADWDFWLKLATVSRTAYLPPARTAFRVHANSQTMSRSGGTDDLRRQLEVVLERHLAHRKECCRHPDMLPGVARFSAQMNAFLAASVHGDRPGWRRLAIDFLALGPAGWHRFVHDSRIAERVAARLRAGIRPRSRAAGAPELSV
jgi:GT2 family glycosyltransferase